MRIFFDCIPCFIRQALDAARLATDDERIHERVLREVLGLAKDLDMSQSPPVMGQKIHRLIRELADDEDPYHNVKRRFNNAALRLYPRMRQYVIQSENVLGTAIRLAIAGNIIDFGVNGRLHERELEKTVSDCLAADLPDVQLESFRRAVNEAQEILYIADNAGEIILDRLLIEQLPLEKVTVAVKGSPVINDATMEDAVLAGLPKIVEVIENGSDAPGTVLEGCSGPFLARFEKADLVVAKGQGNYETLSDADKNIFFVLKAKCPVIARDLGCEVGQMILKERKAFRNVAGMVKEAE
jgi:uncharacterized protein with ATP-grasp and redox domains